MSKPNCVVNGIPMTLDLKEGIQKQMAAGLYEPQSTAWVRQNLQLGSVFVDAGASFGYYTSLAWSLVGPHGRVFSFEPSPVAYSTLKGNVERAGIGNVTLVNSALGQKAGELTIYMPPAEGLHSPSAFVSHESYVPLRVPLITLDDFEPLAQIDRIDLVKIDVEGSEPDVIEGMRKLISQGRVQRIICEFNSWWLRQNNCSVEALENKFRELRFEIEKNTEWQRNLPAIRGETFDLRDVLFKYVG